MAGFAEGSTASREPSQSKKARTFDPDLLPWEKQPTESDDQYAAFRAFRDSADRKVENHGPSARQWSSIWSWGYRTYKWDLYVAAEEDQQMVRYRMQMNERHRNIAQNALVKVSQWLINMNPDTMKPADAARWFEIAVRVQREAAGAMLAESAIPGIPDPAEDDNPNAGRTLAEVLGLEGLDDDAAAVALYRAAQNGG